MRADAWSVGFGLFGLVAIVGMYASLRYALPDRANDPELLLYMVVGLCPYVFVAYGSGACPRRTWSRLAANVCGVVVCLAGGFWLWMAVEEALHIRAMREAGRERGLSGTAFMVLLIFPIQCGAALIAALIGVVASETATDS